MKKSIPPLVILVILICFCSCTRVIHSQQVLQSIHTKNDLLKQLGEPDEKKPGDGMEEWIYNRGPASIGNQLGKKDTASNPSVKIIPDSLKVKDFTPRNKYIRFIIDTNNNVVGYKNNGVDLTKKVRVNPALEALKFLGGVTLVIIVIGLSLGVQNYINW